MRWNRIRITAAGAIGCLLIGEHEHSFSFGVGLFLIFQAVVLFLPKDNHD
jgi:hypothetical protein